MKESKTQTITEEPPMLGEDDEAPLLEIGCGNQKYEGITPPLVKADESGSLMDEMVAVGVRAKEEKRRVQEHERNRKNFGNGLKKGFFNRPAAEKRINEKERSKPPQHTGKVSKQRGELLRIVKPQESTTSTATPSFVFPEVQEAMASASQLDPKEWMNARFFEKLSRNPKLSQALQNPAFSQAIADMQTDPRAAMLKYQKDEAVSTMLRDFMAFLGSHFEEMGNQAAAAQPNEPLRVKQKSPVQQQQVAAAIEDLDERRRAAIAEMPRAPAEEEQVQRILQNPELLRALSDSALMQRLHECQQAPHKLRELLADPKTGAQLRLLLDHGLVSLGGS